MVGQLVLVPAEADPEHRPAPGEVVERGHGLGRDDGLALGGQGDAGAQADAFGDRRGRGQGHEGVEGAPVLLGQLGVAGGWRGAAG